MEQRFRIRTKNGKSSIILKTRSNFFRGYNVIDKNEHTLTSLILNQDCSTISLFHPTDWGIINKRIIVGFIEGTVKRFTWEEIKIITYEDNIVS